MFLTIRASCSCWDNFCSRSWKTWEENRTAVNKLESVRAISALYLLSSRAWMKLEGNSRAHVVQSMPKAGMTLVALLTLYTCLVQVHNRKPLSYSLRWPSSIYWTRSVIFLSSVPLSMKCRGKHLNGLQELGTERNTNVHFNITINVGGFSIKNSNYLGLCCRLPSCFPSFHFTGKHLLLLAIRLVLQPGNALLKPK